MPAKIVVAHEDEGFLALLLSKLSTEGYVAVGFNGGITAFNALNSRQHVDVLITGVTLVSGQPHGLALANVAASRRRLLKVIFIARPEQADHVKQQGIGCLLPADPNVIVQAVVAEVDPLTPFAPRAHQQQPIDEVLGSEPGD